MANLEPMPISSLPEGSIQDGDKMIIYRDSNGKAYQSDASSMESVAEIKEEVDKLSDDVEQISADLTDMGDMLSMYARSLDALLEFVNGLSSYQTMCVTMTADVSSAITNGNLTAVGKGIITRMGTDYFDFVLERIGTPCSLFVGRYNQGTVTYLAQIVGTSLL